eukprot:1251479-Prymnesium_polylepis.1
MHHAWPACTTRRPHAYGGHDDSAIRMRARMRAGRGAWCMRAAHLLATLKPEPDRTARAVIGQPACAQGKRSKALHKAQQDSCPKALSIL